VLSKSSSNELLDTDLPNFSQEQNDIICLRVRINRSAKNSNLNVSLAEANEALDRLNKSFAPYNIHFHQDTEPILFKNAAFYDCVTPFELDEYNRNNNIYRADAINIFLFNEDNNSDIGKWSYVDEAFHVIILAGNNLYYENIPLFNSKVITHEVGHAFGLVHTHLDLMPGCEVRDGDVWESTGNPSSITGDMIADTPADPNLAGNVDACGNWNQMPFIYEVSTTFNCITNVTDTYPCPPPEPITNYNPDTHNYMSYTHPEAMSRFSEMQITKMRNKILNSGEFDSILLNTSCQPTAPDCTNNDTIAANMLQTFTKTSDNPCTYALDVPQNLQGCIDILLDWGISGSTAQIVDLSQTQITVEYPDNGSYNLEITILENGVECGFASNNVIIDCVSVCPDCNDIAIDISESLTESNYDCKTWEIEIPDYCDNITGKISWGDGSTEKLINSGIQKHKYNSEGNYNIQIKVLKDGQICNKYSSIEVSCNSPCIDPCNIIPSFTYELLNFCTYRFVANSGSDCEDISYEYKWYLTRLGFPTNYVGSGQSIDLFVEDYPMLKLVVENTQQNCEVEINQQLLFGCFQLSPNNGTIEQKLSDTNRSITIFPNPSKQNSELRFIGIDYKEVSTIEVYDIIGNIKTIMKPRNNSFKIEKLTSGIYFIRFNTTKGIVQKKLIIE